jgi:hypothetical protein
MFLLLSCNKKNDNEKQTKIINENSNKMNSTNIDKNETLINGLDLNNSFFDKKDLHLKNYKYGNIFIENIKIFDLLQKQYREDFFNYLEESTSGKEDNYEATLFIDLLMMRISQFEDKNAYYLLKESSKKTGISYMGIEFHNQYLWNLFLDKSLFFIKESSSYNDTEILEFILVDMAKEILKTNSEIRDPSRMCDCDDLKAGMILLSKEKLEKPELKKIKQKFTNEEIIEIDCSPSFENGWKSTTEKYYDIKSVIDTEVEKQLGVKDKIFYKVKIVPILKDYITK